MVDIREEISHDREEASRQRIQFYDELRNIGDDISTSKQATVLGANIRDLVPHFNEFDRRINVHTNEANQLQGTLEYEQPVVCLALEDTSLGGVAALPKVAHIYSRLSARVQVQRFYGFYEKSAQKYAIMEDLSSTSTLGSAIQHKNLPSLSSRLRMAFEIASTMAYLHQVGLLLKSLSDSTVSLKVVDGQLRPIVTDLESARMVSQVQHGLT
jgi:serine/threonine protein kinase